MTERAGKIVDTVGRTALRVGKGVAIGAAAVAAAPLALATLDPILFGVTRSAIDPSVSHVFELARWDW